MGMTTDEEVTYDMARRKTSDWRRQLQTVQRAADEYRLAGDVVMASFASGQAEGIAMAIRELDRVLDSSPVAARYLKEAQ